MVKIESKMKGDERDEKNHNHWVVTGCLIWNGKSRFFLVLQV
jgi:hypothetical protein